MSINAQTFGNDAISTPSCDGQLARSRYEPQPRPRKSGQDFWRNEPNRAGAFLCLGATASSNLHDTREANFIPQSSHFDAPPLHASSPIMPPLSKTAAPLARTWTRHALPTVKPTGASLAVQKRGRADHSPVSAAQSDVDSPFHRSGGTMRDTTNIPSFGKYKSGRDEITNRVFQYFMVGSMGAITAMGAKATVQGQ